MTTLVISNPSNVLHFFIANLLKHSFSWICLMSLSFPWKRVCLWVLVNLHWSLLRSFSYFLFFSSIYLCHCIKDSWTRAKICWHQRVSLSLFLPLEITSLLQWLIQSHSRLSDLGHLTLQERICSAFYSRLHSKSLTETGGGPGRVTCQLSWPSKWHSFETWGYILYQPKQQGCCAMLEEAFPSPAVPLVSFRYKVHPWAQASIAGDLLYLVPSPDSVKGLPQFWQLNEKSVTCP